jgi:quinol monooxygenase YgiN
MVEIIEMDKKVTLFTQMEEKGGPIIIINKFTVKPEEIDQFLRAWAADAQVMKRQPGFISAQLHRGIAGSCVFVNYAVWESPEHLKQAYNNPEFQALMAHYPSSVTASPHLFRKVAVSGICLAG